MRSGLEKRHGVAALVATLLLSGPSLSLAEIAAAPGTAEQPVASFPADLPLDADGVPLRPLSNDELHRLLLAHSARNAVATWVLVNCHAMGFPFGHLPGGNA